MKKKCYIFALCSFLIALAIYVFSFYMYHYMGPDGSFGPVYHKTPVKPFVNLLFAIWGVTHQFAAVTALLVGKIFFSDGKTRKEKKDELDAQ